MLNLLQPFLLILPPLIWKWTNSNLSEYDPMLPSWDLRRKILFFRLLFEHPLCPWTMFVFYFHLFNFGGRWKTRLKRRKSQKLVVTENRHNGPKFNLKCNWLFFPPQCWKWITFLTQISFWGQKYTYYEIKGKGILNQCIIRKCPKSPYFTCMYSGGI